MVEAATWTAQLTLALLPDEGTFGFWHSDQNSRKNSQQDLWCLHQKAQQQGGFFIAIINMDWSTDYKGVAQVFLEERPLQD